MCRGTGPAAAGSPPLQHSGCEELWLPLTPLPLCPFLLLWRLSCVRFVVVVHVRCNCRVVRIPPVPFGWVSQSSLLRHLCDASCCPRLRPRCVCFRGPTGGRRWRCRQLQAVLPVRDLRLVAFFEGKVLGRLQLRCCLAFKDDNPRRVWALSGFNALACLAVRTALFWSSLSVSPNPSGDTWDTQRKQRVQASSGKASARGDDGSHDDVQDRKPGHDQTHG